MPARAIITERVELNGEHMLKTLFIGDIFAKPGRRAIESLVPQLRDEYNLDIVIANAENAAAGRGVTQKIAQQMTNAGVDFMTTGNHVWDQRQFLDEIENVPNIVRPANYPKGTPGRGCAVTQARDGTKVAVINLCGKLFMSYDCPFVLAKPMAERLLQETPVLIVDIHAEATSEKVAMGLHLDGLASLVVGTHTHVQTADETILPGGTAYITDVGMTGPHDSVIGIDPNDGVERFLTQLRPNYASAKNDPRLSAVYVEIDPETGRASSIERLNIPSPS